MKQDFVYESTALKLLGITKLKFSRLEIEPDKEIPNPHYRSGPPSRLYDRQRIESLANTAEVIAMRPKPRKKKDWNSVFTKKYATWVEALPSAAGFLFNLNRYAKHTSCSQSNKEEIYSLKNRFIELLYNEGYCHAAYEHHKHLPPKECFRCDGEGCERCDETGQYLSGVTLEFAVFEFVINGQPYSWHQPKELIGFKYEASGSPTQINETQVKPLHVKKSKLAEGKALLRWVIENWKEKKS